MFISVQHQVGSKISCKRCVWHDYFLKWQQTLHHVESRWRRYISAHEILPKNPFLNRCHGFRVSKPDHKIHNFPGRMSFQTGKTTTTISWHKPSTKAVLRRATNVWCAPGDESLHSISQSPLKCKSVNQ